MSDAPASNDEIARVIKFVGNSNDQKKEEVAKLVENFVDLFERSRKTSMSS
jgi:hypothetical protein